MRNLLAGFGALVLIVAGAGWYLGWYSFHAKEGGATVHLNTAKAISDAEKGAAALNEKIKKAEEKEKEKEKTSQAQ